MYRYIFGLLSQSDFFFMEDKTINNKDQNQHQINEEINFPEVRVVGPDGEQLGIMSSNQALIAAEEANLDLVLIAPTAKPPVCKILDYKKYLYDQQKKQKEAKKNQKVTETKEIWLSMTIDVGDLNVKAKQTVKFIAAGNRVKVSIRMRGRQQAYSDIGLDVMNRFYAIVENSASVEKKPVVEGRNIIMVLGPKA